MTDNLVITISRQCGSQGKIIGDKLAERMGVKCYDKELIAEASKDSGFTEEIFEKHDEKPTSSFLYSLVMNTYSYGSSVEDNMPLDYKVFQAQYKTIQKIADRESCVIVGRCSDYALEDYPNCVSIFVSASEEDKVSHIMDRYHLTEAKAKDRIVKTDKKRADYYNYYNDKRWGEAKSYDLCINSSVTGLDGAVDVILNFAKLKMEHNKEKAAQ